MVQHNLDEHKKANPDFAVRGWIPCLSCFFANPLLWFQKPSDTPRPRSTLFITDRSMDMVAPFVHEFTYQAMANDLLPIEDGTKYTSAKILLCKYFQPNSDRYTGINSNPQLEVMRIRQLHCLTRILSGQKFDISICGKP
jgi:hypothetical protein